MGVFLVKTGDQLIVQLAACGGEMNRPLTCLE